MVDNQRKFFRVNGMAQVSIHYVPRNQIRRLAEEIYQGGALEGMVEANRNVLEAISVVKKHDHAVGRALEALNDKLDEMLKLTQGGVVEQTEPQPINFSVGGCRFCTNEAYSLREAIDISIRFGNMETVLALALVRDIRKAEECPFGHYEMAVQFRAISKSNSTIIERQVMRVQQEALLARAESRMGED